MADTTSSPTSSPARSRCRPTNSAPSCPNCSAVPWSAGELSRQEAHARYARRYSPAMADALLAGAERQLAGAKAGTTDTVERLTGRPATTFAEWAAGHLDRFA
ncbi:hypothetical protein LT493_04775 [Streptomyces tricolor]|nr:hypothetical protein [Streptomyces tricolor]